MRMITKLADRMLSTVVPEITAGACCPDTYVYVQCGCSSKTKLTYQKLCHPNCTCTELLCSGCIYNKAEC
jgi:hypothetical protein